MKLRALCPLVCGTHRTLPFVHGRSLAIPTAIGEVELIVHEANSTVTIIELQHYSTPYSIFMIEVSNTANSVDSKSNCDMSKHKDLLAVQLECLQEPDHMCHGNV